MADTIVDATTDTPVTLAKAYDPRLVEAGVYDRWEDAGYFQPRERPGREPFVVVMPPPNVTGELHIGHALFVTVEDIMIRWQRMLGDPTLWTARRRSRRHRRAVGGGEGAGEGGADAPRPRPRAIPRARLGVHGPATAAASESSCASSAPPADWTRFVFTMDPGPSRAVRTRLQAPLRQGSTSTAASASSPGARAARPPSPISRSSTETKQATSGRSPTRLSRASATRSSPSPRPARRRCWATPRRRPPRRRALPPSHRPAGAPADPGPPHPDRGRRGGRPEPSAPARSR